MRRLPPFIAGVHPRNLNRRERWLVRPALLWLHRRGIRAGRDKSDRELVLEWWLWRLAGTRMPWHRGAW